MAMVGAVRANTLLMLVPSRILLVRMAMAVRMANWSPACPSATHADSYPNSSASTAHSTISKGSNPRENPTPTRSAISHLAIYYRP